MTKIKFFKAAFYLFFLGYALGSSAQSLEIREKIQAGYKLEDAAFLKQKYKVNKGDSAGKLLLNQSNLMEVDSLGIALYYKGYNQASGRVSKVVDEAGENYMGFAGQQMVVGIWDSALPRLDHVDLQGQIVVVDNADPSLFSKHATHVAGTMVSKGTVQREGRGLMYKASLWASDWVNDFEEMIEVASKGVLVSNHSYGIDPEPIPRSYFGAYLSSSMRIDAIAFRFPYYQPVVAAGNEREDFLKYNPTKNGGDLLLGMAAAKNAVVVAALAGNDWKQLTKASFSNWGPTDDLRIKPDIAARAVAVLSTLDDSTTAYGETSGTSMATPVISSILTIWQEAAIAYLEKPLWSSSMRALLAHSALSLNNTPNPDHKTGWGLANSEKGIELLKAVQDVDGVRLLETDIKQGEVQRYKLKTATDGSMLKVTLSWTDPEGSIKYGTEDDSTPDLINDLDVRLIDAANKVYYPWMLRKEREEIVAVVGDNKVDNLEQITIENTSELKELVLEIRHKGKLHRGVQPYSVLVSGITDFSLDLEAENTVYKEEVYLWPNPAEEFLVLSGIDVNTPFETEVLTVLGKRIGGLNSYLQNNNIILEVGGLAPGLYVVRIRLGSESVDRVFIKKS